MKTDENKKRGRTNAQDKYDKENIETISFKTRKGSRNRIIKAASLSGQSINGFIRSTINEAIIKITGEPMEDSVNKTKSDKSDAETAGT